MRVTPDSGKPLFTFEGGKIIPVSQSKAARAAATVAGANTPKGPMIGSLPTPAKKSALPPGVTQAQIDASLKANPQASKGGYEGVGTVDNPGPDGQTTFGTTTPQFPPGSDPGTPNFVPPDLGSFLNIYGLPTDVQNKVNQIFQNTPDVSQATALAMAYIRGTPWYAQTYPGIQEGIAKGVVSNEADYRNYLNNANQMWKSYYGRDIGGDEFKNLLSSGVDANLLSKQLQSGANLTSLSKDAVAGLFTQDELKQLADRQAGITTAQGDYLAGLQGYAQQTSPIFSQYGKPVSRATVENYYRNGVSADILGRQFAGEAYVNTNRNDIQYATGAFDENGQLTPDELKALGNEQAGIDSTQGQIVQAAYQKALARLHGAFQGVLANPNLNLGPTGLSAPSLGAGRTDVGA